MTHPRNRRNHRSKKTRAMGGDSIDQYNDQRSHSRSRGRGNNNNSNNNNNNNNNNNHSNNNNNVRIEIDHEEVAGGVLSEQPTGEE